MGWGRKVVGEEKEVRWRGNEGRESRGRESNERELSSGGEQGGE